jgi:hypothetical protein
MLRQASLATDPIRGAAQNLVGREKAVLLDTLTLEKLGLPQWLFRVDQASLTALALHCARIG